MLTERCVGCGSRQPIKKPGDLALCSICDRLYFSQVKNYIYSHKSASIDELHKKLGIPISVLGKYVEDDRLFDPLEKVILKEELDSIKQQERKRKQNEMNLKKIMSGISESDDMRSKTLEKKGVGMRFIDYGGKKR